jgi:hypothetical protein
MDRAGNGTQLMGAMKQRDKLRRQIDPLLGVQPLSLSLCEVLRGLMPTLTLVLLF